METTRGTTPANNEQETVFPKDKMGARTSEQKKTEHKEGPVARAIEDQTAKMPSDIFLWMAGGAMMASATLKVVEMVWSPRKERKGTMSLFVGMWAPTLLILGLYNKLVKVAGSDQTSQKS